MSTFKYKAINRDNKSVSGLVEAESESEATSLLKDKGLSISYLEEGGESSKFSFVLGGVKVKDIVIFSRQFSVLISANVSLVQALKLLVEQTENLKFKMIISEIADDIDEGERLSDTLAKRPKVFSNFYVNVIKSGETSGKLDEVLNYLADELEKDYDMSSKIKGAMIYPAFVFSALLVVGMVMMIFVVPKLTAIITESGGELPLPTKILIGTSDFFVNFWWLVILMLIGLVLGIKTLINIPQAKKYIDFLILKAPVFGPLFQKIYIVRFARSMQTLLIGGVNITKALDIVAEVVSNEVYRDLIRQTKVEIEDGNSISTAFLASKEVPGMVSQMMSIGEKTGKLDFVLEKITDFYTREVDNMVANLVTLMEPIIMVTMGIAVGLMVAAIILPMYNMASNF